MAKPFTGTINVDIRGSAPDWTPFEPPVAPYGDQKAGEGRLKAQPGKFSIAGEGLCAGRDTGEAVTGDYPGAAPWRFTGGSVKKVMVNVSGKPYVDLEREAVAMMARK